MIILIGIASWLIAAGVCYLFLRRVTYNLFDPLFLSIVGIAFSAALLTVLCTEELVAWDKLGLFSAVLIAYLAGGRFLGEFFGRASFRRTIIASVSAIRQGEIAVILLATLGMTLALAMLGLRAGAGGDARQAFGRAVRPLLLLQSGFTLFSLLVLLSPKVSTRRALIWLLPLIALSIPFSGKGIIAPLVYWVGLKLYLRQKVITMRAIAAMFLAMVVGGSTIAVLSYGTSNVLASLLLLTQRLWMSGDVYIYAYQSNGLAAVHGNYPVSFLSYVLHPITSLVGVRGYDKPLGAMLASELTREDVFTGPNPQLPVLLDYFFPNNLGISIVNAFTIGLIVIGLRPMGMLLASNVRSRYLRLGSIAAAVFCPGAGFVDTSLALIALIGVAAATTLFVVAELLITRRPAVAFRPRETIT